MSNIYIGHLDGKDFFVDSEVSSDKFLEADQTEMPTLLAEAINLAIAFQDAAARDLGIKKSEVGIYPIFTDCGDTLFSATLLSADTDTDLSVSDSLLLAAYMDMAGISLDCLPKRVLAVNLPLCGTSDRLVIITADNDDTGDIVDRTQAKFIMRLNSDVPRWELSVVGSYDIESDKYISVDGKQELAVDERCGGA